MDGRGRALADIPGRRVSSGHERIQNRALLVVAASRTKFQRERPHIIKMATDEGFDERVFTEMNEVRKGGNPARRAHADAQWLWPKPLR